MSGASTGGDLIGCDSVDCFFASFPIETGCAPLFMRRPS